MTVAFTEPEERVGRTVRDPDVTAGERTPQRVEVGQVVGRHTAQSGPSRDEP